MELFEAIASIMKACDEASWCYAYARRPGFDFTPARQPDMLHHLDGTMNFHLFNARKQLGAPSRQAALTIETKRGLLHVWAFIRQQGRRG